MTLRITTLSENTAGSGAFLGEWGLSILLETGDTSILFDGGKSISTAHNAETLDIDLAKVDNIVLSHGHYGHTGGLRDVLRRMGKEVEVIAHPDIWQAKYARCKNERDRYIGIPFQRRELVVAVTVVVILPLVAPSARLYMAGLCLECLTVCRLSAPRTNALPLI